MAAQRIQFQGLPARICWVGLGDRHRLGLAFNEMVATGELKAPIVIGRDHLDSGSVASPNRETEAMRDGSDAVSDWPLLNALLNTASGATWVSLHHGGGVGMGYSQHAGVVIVCDGSEAAARRIARVLWNDPATGVMRHADAGYESAIECAREQGLKLPMLEPDTGSEVMAARILRDGDLRLARRCGGACAEPTRYRLSARDRWRAYAVASRAVDAIIAAADAAAYGINTGFGLLAQTRIPPEQLERAAAQSGAVALRRRRARDLPDAIVRLVLVLKIASLARGHSGVRPRDRRARSQRLLQHGGLSGDSGAGFGRRLRRSGAAGAPGGDAARRRPGARCAAANCAPREGLRARGPRAARRCAAEGRTGAAQRHAGLDRAGARRPVRDRRTCLPPRWSPARCRVDALQGQRCALR